MSTTYPADLCPNATEDLLLPSGAPTKVPVTRPFFRRWRGEFMGDTYGGKPLVDLDGEPMFAELAVLKLFQKDGWEGVWIDTFRKKYRTAWGEEGVAQLPKDRLLLLQEIHGWAGSSSGSFDVYCWKGADVLFAETKRRSKDRIRATQLRWLEAALALGLETYTFLIVEWSLSNSSAG